MKRVRQTLKSLQKASYWTQLVLIVGAYLAFYLALFILISHATWGLDLKVGLTERLAKMGAYLFMEQGQTSEISPMWGLVNKWGLMVLTAFSSSIFTSKMISHQSNLKFSRPLAYYSPEIIASEQSHINGQYLVHRLLNAGEDDLYNVRITATLRYFHVPTRTFQHYSCHVTNAQIPVLGSQMPFRIYIEMGEIVSAIYKKNLRDQAQGPHDIGLRNIQDEIRSGVRPADADQLILYIEGIDSGEGKLTTASHRYVLGQVQEGKFASIEPRQGQTGFDPADIDRLFDVMQKLS